MTPSECEIPTAGGVVGTILVVAGLLALGMLLGLAILRRQYRHEVGAHRRPPGYEGNSSKNGA